MTSNPPLFAGSHPSLFEVSYLYFDSIGEREPGERQWAQVRLAHVGGEEELAEGSGARVPREAGGPTGDAKEREQGPCCSLQLAACR